MEHKIELHDEDLEEIIREYLEEHAEFDFDAVEVVNNRPMNIWLSAKCRKYVDRDAAAADQEAEASPLGARSKSRGNPTATRREGHVDGLLARPVGPVVTETPENDPAVGVEAATGPPSPAKRRPDRRECRRNDGRGERAVNGRNFS